MFVLLWTPLCELAVLKEEASLVAKSTSTLESPPSSQKHPQPTQWHRNHLEVLCFIPFLLLLKFLAGPGTYSLLFFSTLHIFFFFYFVVVMEMVWSYSYLAPTGREISLRAGTEEEWAAFFQNTFPFLSFRLMNWDTYFSSNFTIIYHAIHHNTI